MLLKNEIQKFRDWARNYPEAERSGEWECDYDEWTDLLNAAIALLSTFENQSWSADEIDDLLYVVARDNECEYLASEIANTPELLMSLSSIALERAEPDAKWQLAHQLGTLAGYEKQAEPLLLQFVEDENEYVSRRALLSLGQLKSSHAEALAERAWETGQEYQRIAALSVLKSISSNKLPEYLRKATEDGREFVVRKAQRILDCESQQ